MSTPTNATCLPMSIETRCITGISARHGPHHAAQTFTTAGWPRRAARRLRRPLRAPGRIWLAWRCRAPTGGGAPRPGRGRAAGGGGPPRGGGEIVAALRVVPAFGGGDE